MVNHTQEELMQALYVWSKTKNKETITEYNSPVAKQRRKDDKKHNTNYAKSHKHPEYL